MQGHNAFKHVIQTAAIAMLGLACLSCASSVPLIGRQTSPGAVVLEFTHVKSEKTSDCLAVCADMVLSYYGVEKIIPDSVLPLDLMELSNSLNTDESVNEAGNILFSAVVGMTAQDITTQLSKQRPLIIAYRPSSSEEYHSVVVTGVDPARKRFYVNDPASRRPVWKKMSKIPVFADSGMYLVMFIGLRES